MKAGSRGFDGPIRPIEVMDESEGRSDPELMCGVCGESDESEEVAKVFCTNSEREEEKEGEACHDDKEDKAKGREWRGEGEEVKGIRANREERVVKEMVDPRRPSNNDVEKHRRTHIPYRNLCEICVKSMGKDAEKRFGEGERFK